MWPTKPQSGSSILDQQRIKQRLRARREGTSSNSAPLKTKTRSPNLRPATKTSTHSSTQSTVSTATQPSELNCDDVDLEQRRNRIQTIIEEIVEQRQNSLSLSLLAFQRRIVKVDDNGIKANKKKKRIVSNGRSVSTSTDTLEDENNEEDESKEEDENNEEDANNDDKDHNKDNNKSRNNKSTRDSAVQTEEAPNPKSKPIIKPKSSESSRTGTKTSAKSNSSSSSLKPKMAGNKTSSSSTLSRHKVGVVPDYIRRYQKAESDRVKLEKLARIEMEERKFCPPGHVRLGDDDRVRVLAELRVELDELVAQMNSLPVSADTRRVRERRRCIDERMANVEEAIKAYNRNVVYVRDDENCNNEAIKDELQEFRNSVKN